jgi:hypothetical protein
MDRKDHDEIRSSCSARLRPPCGGPHLPRHGRLTASPGPGRRCRARTASCVGPRRPGYLTDLGACWLRRFPWSPVSWRNTGPHG